MAAFWLTRKVAQDLGAFWEEVQARGWETALKGRGLAALAQGSEEMLAPAVSEVLAGSGGGLEEAVVRTSLAMVIGPLVQSQDRPDPPQLVRQFLATAVYLRLALDLGKPLEAAAGGYGRLRDGLSRIKAVIDSGRGGDSRRSTRSRGTGRRRALASAPGLDLGHGNHGGPQGEVGGIGNRRNIDGA